MNGRIIVRLAVLVATAGLSQGCTALLWQHDFSRPTVEPHLKLYRVGDDVLVQYDEINEDNDHSWRRSFLLNANTNAIANDCKPFFFDPKKSDVANPIPLFIPPPTNAVDAPIYATSKYENGDPFFIMNSGKTNGPFELPVYRDTKNGNVGRALLTPVAMAADAAAVGAYLAVSSYDEEQEEKTNHLYTPVESPRRKK